MNTNIKRIILGTLFLLCIPLVAMQFTEEVQWTLFDFIFAGVLLMGSGLTIEFVSRRMSNAAYKIAVAIAVLTSLGLIWVNGAVGIIGSEDNPANILYGGVLFVGLVGAALSYLKPRGMSFTLFAMAVVQALVPVIAIMIWDPALDVSAVALFMFNGFFVVAYAVSGILFRHAAANTQLDS